jgi:hypothetical protein
MTSKIQLTFERQEFRKAKLILFSSNFCLIVSRSTAPARNPEQHRRLFSGKY